MVGHETWRLKGDSDGDVGARQGHQQVSEVYFSHWFRSDTGSTPSTFRLNVRD